MNLNRFKVQTRLAIGFAVVLILLVVSLTLAVRALGKLSDRTDNIVTTTYSESRKAQDLLDMNNVIARALRNALLVKTKEQVIVELDRVVNMRKAAGETLVELDRSIGDASGRALYRTMLAARVPFGESVDEFIRLLKEGQHDTAIDYMLTTLRERQNTYIAAIGKLIQHETDLMESARIEAQDTYREGRTVAFAMGAMSLALGIVVAALISRQLMRELGGEPGDVAAIAGRIAAGDLVAAIETRPGDQTSLLFAIRAMRDSLGDIVGRVRSGADSIQTSASEIASGNMDLSSRTEQQASSLEETAASMEELTATVRQNVASAQQAEAQARSATEIATKGGAVVTGVVETMAGIHDSAQKISDIIGVIDSIAFQTNILALNAAVEAARAGEQGRGFAVVASEVRTLAQRSAAAAKEIKVLIDESSGKVEAGTAQVGQAGASMKEILRSIDNLTGLMSEIRAASQEQGIGIEQVNRAIAEIDTVTQQNAALVEEAAAAAEAQQEQAQQLVGLVGTFQLAPQTAAAPGRHRPRSTSAAGAIVYQKGVNARQSKPYPSRLNSLA